MISYFGCFVAAMSVANMIAAFIYGLHGDPLSVVFSLNALATGLPFQLRLFG